MSVVKASWNIFSTPTPLADDDALILQVDFVCLANGRITEQDQFHSYAPQIIQ
jgi:hypothetical protein